MASRLTMRYAAARGNTTTKGSYFWTGDAVPAAMIAVGHDNNSKGGIPTAGVPLTVRTDPQCPSGF